MPQIVVQSRDRSLRLEYQAHCAGPGDWIVLIRGLGTQLIEWSPRFIQCLVDDGLQVLIFDNRDVGLSEKLAEDYSLEDMAADVIGLMNALDIEQAHIFGVSMGGMIAQLVAHGYQERVSTLMSVMSSSGADGLPRAKPAVWDWLTIEADGREDTIKLDAESRVVFGSPGYPETESERLEMSTRTYDRCFYPEGVARQMRAISATGSRIEKLNAIKVPTLVIHGEDDALIPPEHGEDTARQIPGARYESIAGMGHNLPDALAPMISRLVNGFIHSHQ